MAATYSSVTARLRRRDQWTRTKNSSSARTDGFAGISGRGRAAPPKSRYRTLLGPRDSSTPIAVSVASNSATSGTDFAAVSGFTITIPANTASQTGTFSLTPTQDSIDERDETLLVNGMASINNFAVTGAVLTITDDDATPAATLALSSDSIDENGGQTTVTATLDRESSVQTTIVVSVEAVSPATSSDYSVSANTTLTIAAGSKTSTGTVRVTGVDNDADTLDKKVKVKGTASNAVGITGPADLSLTITDDDGVPTGEIAGANSTEVALSVAPASVGEGAGATTVTVTATLNGQPRDQANAVEVQPTSGTAVSGTDFAAVSAFTITIPANNLSQRGTFSFTPTQDSIDEPDETVNINGGTTVPDIMVGGTQLTITDDDAAPTVSLALSNSSISENGGIATVTASLNRASSKPTPSRSAFRRMPRPPPPTIR